MPQVMVADVLCGGGKTSSAINLIKSSPPQQRFLFITPYLDECKRIVQSCPEHDFVQPVGERKGKTCSKLRDMQELVMARRNIASTHALFPRYTPDMLRVLKDSHYTLIIDEAYDMTQPITNKERDNFFDELKKGTLAVDSKGQVTWVASPPSTGSSLLELYQKIANGAVYLYGQRILVWLFPREILMAFDRIIVLTYMFDAQSMKYYFDVIGLDYSLVGTKRTEDGYRFCATDDPDMIQQKELIKGKIRILDKPKLNRIGEEDGLGKRDKKPLSSGWFKSDKEKNQSKLIQELAHNIRNIQKNVYKCPQRAFMWTVYKEYRDIVADKNLRNTFVPMNQRAVNSYRNCQYLAYGINRYVLPDSYNYFFYKGIQMDARKWALSEMIQWIWRSAIRDGKDIWIYIPSSRMRGLLEDWIKQVSADANAAA